MNVTHRELIIVDEAMHLPRYRRSWKVWLLDALDCVGRKLALAWVFAISVVAIFIIVTGECAEAFDHWVNTTNVWQKIDLCFDWLTPLLVKSFALWIVFEILRGLGNCISVTFHIPGVN